jgi:hypothetical protein
VGPRAGLDTEARGKILCPRRESNPDRPVVQPVARHYTVRLMACPLNIEQEVDVSIQPSVAEARVNVI